MEKIKLFMKFKKTQKMDVSMEEDIGLLRQASREAWGASLDVWLTCTVFRNLEVRKSGVHAIQF